MSPVVGGAGCGHNRAMNTADHPHVAGAALWMCGALVSFTAMAVGGRELSGQLSTFQILFFRSLIGALVLGALALRTGGAALRPRGFGLHVVRNVAHFFGQFGWFYALGAIPLAQVVSIEFTTPVWTAILAMALLGERMTRTRALAVVLGFAGILAILRPGFDAVGVASLAVLGAAFAFAVTHTVTKRLTRNNGALCILFWMTMIQLPLGLVPSLADWSWPAGAHGWFWVVVVGAGAMTAHYSMARALALADATVVVPLDFLRVPLVTLVGALAYAEGIDAWLLLGAGLILAGNAVNLRAERRRA